jgi:hypothetical protein
MFVVKIRKTLKEFHSYKKEFHDAYLIMYEIHIVMKVESHSDVNEVKQ